MESIGGRDALHQRWTAGLEVLANAVFKRRLIFGPLPEMEPLQAHNRGPPAGDEAPVIPLLHPKAPVTPEPLVITGRLKSS